MALAVDYTAPLRGGTESWGVEPGHFAERHGLIVLIALGESLVALGVGRLRTTQLERADDRRDAARARGRRGALVGVLRRRRARRGAEATSLTGAARNRMARDSYSYLHFLLVAGIVLFAFGLKVSLTDLHRALPLVPAVALCGGPRSTSPATSLPPTQPRHGQQAAHRRSLVLAALVPFVRGVSSIWGVAAVAAVCVTLIGYEALRFAEVRDKVRHAEAIETS